MQGIFVLYASCNAAKSSKPGWDWSFFDSLEFFQANGCPQNFQCIVVVQLAVTVEVG
jgi:hypothetical protein